jgi:hypothetical protein
VTSLAAFFTGADDVLRNRGWAASPGLSAGVALRLALYMILAGAGYGLFMGTYAAVVGDRAWSLQSWQAAYSALKVPLLVAATFAISLPSFAVINMLAGLGDDLADVVRALFATQAALALILFSLAPFTGLCYASLGDAAADYTRAVSFNGLMFAAASLSAQVLLRRYFRTLIARNRRHRWMFWLWIAIYAFVGIQMAWVLRPFIGSPDAPVTFFREGAWSNAYVAVLRIVWSAVSG